MHIRRVSYTISSDIKNPIVYTNNLSSLFYKIPCETRTEVRPIDEDMFPNSKQRLICITFNKQEDLIRAWQIVNNLTVKVEYRGPIKRFRPTYRSLHCDYKTFLDVMDDGTGNLRKLKAFEDLMHNNLT